MCKKTDKEIILSRMSMLPVVIIKNLLAFVPDSCSQTPERGTTSLEFPESSICYS